MLGTYIYYLKSEKKFNKFEIIQIYLIVHWNALLLCRQLYIHKQILKILSKVKISSILK